MIIAVGRILNKNSLVGLRIFNTDDENVKDINIEDSKSIKIKNIKSVNKLGVVGDKDNPWVILGNIDNNYKLVDIRGKVKVVKSLNRYKTIDLLSNVEQYRKYMALRGLIGEESDFEFKIKEDTDDVLLIKYRSNKDKSRTIEIPKFVTSIKLNRDEYGGPNGGPFRGVRQNLKIIYKGNRMKSIEGIFSKYRGKELDISEFDTSAVENMKDMFHKCDMLKEIKIIGLKTKNVKTMEGMFKDCEFLEKVVINKLDMSSLEDISYMFSGCTNLWDLRIGKLDTSNVRRMCGVFNGCESIEELDLSNFNTSNVKDMRSMFKGCFELKELNVSSFDTSNVENMFGMFSDCGKLRNLDLREFNLGKVKDMKYIFQYTQLTPENTGLRARRG